MSSAHKKSIEPTHITNIRYPYSKTWDKLNSSIEFEIANVSHTTVNAIRRIMIADVKTVGFRTEPYKLCGIKVIQNDTPLHDQLILHRLAMVPIHIAKPDTFDIDDHLFIMNVSNNKYNIIDITTEHFQVKRVSTNKFLSRDEVNKLFPPDGITGDYILLNRLRAKHFAPSTNVSQNVVEQMASSFNKTVDGDDITHFQIEGKACISNGAENGHFSPVSCAAYINTVDPARAEFGLKEYIDKQNETAKIKNITPMTMEQLKRRFELTERARYFYINDKDEPNVFTFKIETIGAIPSLIIFHRAIDILKDKIQKFISNLVSKNENVITIRASEQLNGGYDIIVKNEDDTLGNIIQSHFCIMFADYSLPTEKQKLKYIGYKKPHPLENHIIFAIQGQNDNFDELINDIIKPGCSEVVKMLNKIQYELESTHQFISELKLIK